MVASKNDLIYLALPGDPLRNLAIIRHFIGYDFETHGEEILVLPGKILDIGLKLYTGTYQTYHKDNNNFVPWNMMLITITWTGVAYKFYINSELWCTKIPRSDHAYFPNENARILFEKYFGIR